MLVITISFSFPYRIIYIIYTIIILFSCFVNI
nr:MAG TPA: hypothetical protein [Caudoviricetes sp.]DAY99307.1 MAG TPA: hypothetical protein [Caudoviricetes sp.]